jgi:uncharacterized membrane protein
MYIGLKHLHSYLAILVVLLVAIAVINAVLGLTSSRSFTSKDRKIALFALISVHTQFLFGLILYFVSPLAFKAMESGMGSVMKSSTLRLYSVEHPLIMLVSVVLITIGNARAKRATSNKEKFRAVSLFFGLAFILILSRIPWSAWLN